MWDWHSFFVKIGIPASVSSRYAEIFRQNRVSKDMLPDLDKATLADLGVTAVGDQLAILKHARDEAYDMEPDSPSKLRVRIAGPGAGAGHSSNGSSGSSEQRRGRPAPDRSEIYHIKMPEGSTARTKEIMQNASVLRKHGLTVRGTTGVRQGGRSVSPVDKKSAAVVRMRQDRQEMAMRNDPVISRLGVRGLHSDLAARPISGRVQKRSVQKQGAGGSRLREAPQYRDDVAIRVQIPSASRVERRISGQDHLDMSGVFPRSRMTTSIANRISRSNGSGLPRVTVKLREAPPVERTLMRNIKGTRKPVQSRLSSTSARGKLARASRVAPRSLVQDDYFVDEEGLSAEEEEYMDEEMAWEDLEEEELDEEVEELVDEFAYVEERPSVYNRLSRVPPPHSYQ